jgi:hypothetical protein
MPDQKGFIGFAFMNKCGYIWTGYIIWISNINIKDVI